MNSDPITAPVLKSGSLWVLAGAAPWSDIAAIVATIYSVILIGEWVWKRFIKTKPDA